MLKGNLAPDGCVIKPRRCDPRFLKHTGPAVVFDNYPEHEEGGGRRELAFTADNVLVLRNAGPQGGPGMPEWGMLPMPKKLLKQGCATWCGCPMRGCAARATAPACCTWRPNPISAGRWRCVRTGDIVTLDVDGALDPHGGLATRSWRAAAPNGAARPRFERGYGWAFTEACRAGRPGLRLRLPAHRFRRARPRAG